MPRIRPSIAVPRVPIPGPRPGPGPVPPTPVAYELDYLGTQPVTPGSTLIFELTGPAAAEGRPGRFIISGVSASDIEGGRLTGTFTVGPDGNTFLEIRIARDAVFTPGEALTLTVSPPGAAAIASAPISTSNFNPNPGPNPGATFTLTTNIETIPVAGVVAPANAVFSAPAGVTPQGIQSNTLQSGDVLNGSGQQNVLNATLVAAATTVPTVNNIPTVNITSLTAGAALNLGNSTGVNTLGDINSVADVTITGLTTAVTTLNKSGSFDRNTTVTAQSGVLNGNSSLQINLNGVDGGDINVTPVSPTVNNGYGTINVRSASPLLGGTNTVGRIIGGDSLENLNITGSSLKIEGDAGANALAETLEAFNASGMIGALTVGSISDGVSTSEGASVVNASAEDLSFVGSNFGTTLFVESASLDQEDTLRGGSGTNDTLVLTGRSSIAGVSGVVAANNGAFNASGFETLAITDTQGNGVAGGRALNNPANFNLANVTGINTLQLGTASSTVVGLTNLSYTNPFTINVTGTGRSGVNAANGVNAVFTGAVGDADTVNYTFGNQGTALSSSTTTLTVGQLSLPNIENINLTFNDLNSNVNLAYTDFLGLPATELFRAGSTSQVRFVNVTAASGEDARTNALDGAIDLGAVGGTAGSTVRGGVINSAASVTATFGNRAGASFTVSGIGDHSIQVLNLAGADSNINGTNATGDVRFAVSEPTAAGQGRALFTSGSGDDALIGGSGNDVLTSNADDDRLEGNAGIDVLSAGEGLDVLIGGAGNDVLTGGVGVDSFVYSQSLRSDIDSISDFAFGASGDNISYFTGTGAFQAVTGTGFGTATGTAVSLSDANGSALGTAAVSVLASFGGGTTAVTLGTTSNFLVLTAAGATSFAGAIGTAGVNVSTNFTSGEALAAAYFDSASNEAVFGFIAELATTGVGTLNSSDNFTEIARASSTFGAFSTITGANVDFF